MPNQRVIGLDLFVFDPEYSGGVTTFTLGLLNGLYESLPKNCQLKLIASKRNRHQLSKLVDGRNIEIIELNVSFLYRYVNRLIVYISWLLRQFRLRYWFEKFFRKTLIRSIEAQVAVLIVPTTTLNFYSLSIPTILCMHDIQQEYHPENFTLNELALRWAPYRLSAWKASTIQVSSNFIKSCILEKFPFTSNKEFLIAPEGVDPKRFSTSSVSKKPSLLDGDCIGGFLFYPAQIWKHKNHRLLIRALASFRDQMGYELPCVFTGTDFGYWPQVESLIKDSKLESIHYLGRVELAELIWCYKNSLAVLALGTHESSSLPVREGAVFGKPLICSNIPPNIESSATLNLNMFNVDDEVSLKKSISDVFFDDGSLSLAACQNESSVKNYYWASISKLYLNNKYAVEALYSLRK